MKRLPRRFRLLYYGTLTLVAVLWTVAAGRASTTGRIEWGRCPGIPRPVSGAAMRCGWLYVGERVQAAPVRLRVVVLQRRPDRLDAHPVVYVPGGPGDPAGLESESVRRWRAWQQRSGWPHDIVLYDPRATGLSRPQVECPEATATGDSPPGSVDPCRAALGGRVAAALGPAAQLRDLDALIAALPVAGVHLWGLSYGTRLARLYAQRHPARVRSLILDSPILARQGSAAALPGRIARALAALDRHCRSAASECARRRAPSAVVQDLLRRFERHPPTLETPKSFVVTPARLLLMLLFTSFEDGDRDAVIERLRRAHRGDAEALAPLAARLRRIGRAKTRNTAVYWSTRCAFDPVPGRGRRWRAALARHPAIASYMAPLRAATRCRRWPVPAMPLPADSAAPDTPTLLLSGANDALISAASLRRFTRGRADRHWIRVPGAGHAVTLTRACAQRAVALFLGAPGALSALDCGARAPRRACTQRPFSWRAGPGADMTHSRDAVKLARPALSRPHVHE